MSKLIIFPTLEPWQKDPFMEISASFESGKTFVIKSIRQVGKSILSELLLIYYSLKYPKTVSIIIEPTFSQCRKIHKDINNMLAGSNVIESSNSSIMELEFINGSTIICKSAELKDNLRGSTCSGILIIDEASSISNEVFDITAPFCNAHKAPILMVSTPKFKIGRFYESFIDPTNICYDWTKYDTSKYLTKEMLEKYRRKVARNIFIQDYLGQFAELNGTVFGDFSKCVNNNIDKESPIEVMSIDWGTGSGNDYTAITILNKQKQMVYVEYFNDKDATETINRIAEINKLYKPKTIIAEKNSIGNVYLDLLKKKLNRQIIAFNTTNESKNNIINKLQVAFQNNDIQILDDIELLNQLAAYEQLLTNSGKSTFNGIAGMHDDLVMSLAIGYSIFTKHNIDIR